MRKKWIWIITTIFCAFSFFFLFSGFTMAIYSIVKPQPLQPKNTETRPVNPKKTLIIGLGDSLTRGIGDSTGLGYIGRFRNKWQQQNKAEVSLINLAISGQTSDQLVKQLKNKEILAFVQQANLIFLSIGGNDLNRGSGTIENIDIQASDQALKRYRQNLTQILTTLRKENKKAPILLLGIYNPYIDRDNEKTTSALVTKWNHAIMEIASQFSQVVVIPTFDLFQLNPKVFLDSDHFHPNDQGYEQIAIRIWQVSKAGERK